MWDASVSQARKTLEAICIEICEEENLCHPRPPSSHTLDDLIAVIERASSKNAEFAIPKRFPKVMRTLQDFGNLATHDQGESSSITQNTCVSCLSLLEELSDWFHSLYCKKPPEAPSKGKASSTRPKRPETEAEFYADLRINHSHLEDGLKKLFEDAAVIGLKLEWGSRSRSVKTPFKVDFPDEGHPKPLVRNFNFGVFKSSGIFYNRSCQRSLGRSYLDKLSKLIPGTCVRIHDNEFRNSIVQTNQDPVPLEWLVSRKKEWLELVSCFLSDLKTN